MAKTNAHDGNLAGVHELSEREDSFLAVKINQ